MFLSRPFPTRFGRLLDERSSLGAFSTRGCGFRNARAERSRRIASFPRRYSPERTPTKAEAKLLAEFTTKEEAVFKEISRLMQLIAVLFTIHAVLTAWAVCFRLLTASGPAGEIVGDFFGDPLDGLQYAFFIRGASLGFAAIERTQGQDIWHLMNALSSQKWLWKQMRVPLFIKSIKLAVTIGPLVQAYM